MHYACFPSTGKRGAVGHPAIGLVRASFCYNRDSSQSPKWRYRLGVRTEDSQSSNPGSIPGSATNKSAVQRNPPGWLWKLQEMGGISRFLLSNRTGESVLLIATGQLGSLFSGEHPSSPVSKTPCGECDLDFCLPSGVHQHQPPQLPRSRHPGTDQLASFTNHKPTHPECTRNLASVVSRRGSWRLQRTKQQPMRLPIAEPLSGRLQRTRWQSL